MNERPNLGGMDSLPLGLHKPNQNPCVFNDIKYISMVTFNFCLVLLFIYWFNNAIALVTACLDLFSLLCQKQMVYMPVCHGYSWGSALMKCISLISLHINLQTQCSGNVGKWASSIRATIYSCAGCGLYNSPQKLMVHYVILGSTFFIME